MRLFVKHMVSHRCKMLVEDYLNSLKIQFNSIELGVIETSKDLDNIQYQKLNKKLSESGLELIDDKKSILAEKTKNLVIEMIRNNQGNINQNYSSYLSQKLNYDYTYLSNIFSEDKGVTLKQYIIVQKIEKVKELILYNELSLTEISFMMNYSSLAHLSSQFKKITGMTPSQYKRLKEKGRKNLEDM